MQHDGRVAQLRAAPVVFVFLPLSSVTDIPLCPTECWFGDVSRRIYLQVLWLHGFVPMSVGTILFWEGEDEKISSCNTDNDPVSQ